MITFAMVIIIVVNRFTKYYGLADKLLTKY